MGIPITECPLQRVAREALDKCDALDVTSPLVRAEAVSSALLKSGHHGATSASLLVHRIFNKGGHL